jgi:N-acetylglucosaminyl-diphospho-decaprenol L-rhamnosyltransferase
MTVTQKKTVAAVILNHNERDYTLKLVGGLAKGTTVDAIAVVDNSDKSALSGREAELGSERVRFLKAENNGYARCTNAGLRLLEQNGVAADYIIISNPDVEVTEECIEKCIGFLDEHPEYAVVSPHMFKPDGTQHPLAAWRERSFLCDLAYSSGLLSRIIGMYRETYPQQHWQTPFSTVDCVTGSFFMVRGEAFKKAGCFDEKTFLFYEEDILGFKLKRLGYKEAVLNTCTFVHYEGVSSGRKVGFIQKYLIMQRSRLYFHRTYKRLNPFAYGVLCLATALGLMESLVKTAVYKIK